MKKKYLAAIVGVMMAATSVTACGAATTDTKETAAESSDDKDTEDTAADSTVMNRSANFFLFTREPESITQGKNLFLSRLAMLFIIIRETSMKWKIPVTQKSVLTV